MRDRSLSARELALIFLFWTSLATLSSVNRLLDPRGFGFRMSPAAPIAFAFVESWAWAALTPLVFALSSRVSNWKSSWLVRVAVLLLAGVIVSVLIYLVLDIAREQIFPIAPPRRRGGGSSFTPLRDIGRFRFLNQLLLYFAVLAAGFAREFFLREQARGAEATKLEAQLAEARLDALRMQLDPHFLFNTLNAVSALVERDPAGVRKMIARLSELLRYTIDRHGSDQVALREELAFLQKYIEIMEIRFQGRLRVTRDIEPETLEARVPNLILQPIVENALEHGVSRLAGGGEVTIASKRVGDTLVLTVRDNGPGLSAAEPRGGVGLGNTRARLTQLYGAAASLTLKEEEGVIATIVLPWRCES